MSKKRCLVPDCYGESKKRGYCTKHYKRWRRHGDPLGGDTFRNLNPPDTCIVDGCSREHLALGYCLKHYKRDRRYGDPSITHLNRDHPEICCVIDCGEEYYAKDRCRIHYYRWRYRNDRQHRLRSILATRVRHSLEGESATREVRRWLGCSIPELIEWIESRFGPDMTWENWGKIWELDHIIPLAYFDLTREAARRRALHWSNLQPLAVEQNKSKSDRLLFEDAWAASIRYRATEKEGLPL